MTDTILGTQVGASIALVHVLEWLKNEDWFPWVTANSGTINRVVSLVIAFGTAIGLHFTLAGSIYEGGSVTFVYPPLVTILTTMAHGIGQYGIQQMYYVNVVAPKKA